MDDHCGQLVASIIALTVFAVVVVGLWILVGLLIKYAPYLIPLFVTVGYFAWQALLCWARNDDNLKP